MDRLPGLPVAVAALLAGVPEPGRPEQAFHLLSTDVDGRPRAMLLSRAELAADSGDLLAVLAPSTSRANVERARVATFLAVEGTTQHVLGLDVHGTRADGDLLGVRFAVVAAKADSLGIPLQPLSYTPTEALARAERWVRSGMLLQQLAGG